MKTTRKKFLSVEEQKQSQLSMLKFIDKTCRENNIKYSLIGGSLIGAIRHQGYIPWDDDIDIILTKDNYDKLKDILDQNTGRYQTLKYGRGGERFAFLKLIDTRTHAKEETSLTFNQDYGIFVDIFCYHSAPNNEKERLKHFRKMKLLTNLITRRKLDFKNDAISKNLLRFGKNIISKLLGYKYLHRTFERISNKYDCQDTDYVMSGWLVYSFGQELQLKKNTEEYIDAKFENLTVMIFKNYDEILRTTFGDYMQLPPESERIPKHSITAWWREKNE